MDQDIEDIAAVLEGDRERYRGLMTRHGHGIARFVISQGIPGADRDDLVQDIFMKAYTSLVRFDQTRPFPLWLTGIAVNSVRNYWRKHYRRKELLLSGEEENREAGLLYDRADTRPEPLEDILSEDARREIRKSLNVLKPDQKIAVSLFYFEELSVSDIRRATGWSESKIKVLLHRSRQKLKSRLSVYFEEEENQ